MRKSSIRAFPVIHRRTKYRLETGFTMLEAVVVVGVLLALAVGGFISYGSITDNAKMAKVKSAASEIHTAMAVANFDGDSSTKPQDVIDTWNLSTDNIKVEILEPTSPNPTENGDFCVAATNVDNPHIAARAGSCDGVTGGAPDDGSSPSVTYDPITTGPGISSRGIRYVNAVLAVDASTANLSQDWDAIYASSEWVERTAAFEELTYFERVMYDNDPYYRVDSGLPTLNEDYQSRLAAFESDPTVANQQAMVTAHRALFAGAVANFIPESGRSLVPAPSNPEKFQGVTIAAGTGVDAVVRVAIPTSLYKPEWTIGASWHDGLILGANTVGVDGEYTYWDVTLNSATYTTTPDGTITGSIWEVGAYEAFLTAVDNQGVSHSMNFRITVE